MTAQLMNSRDHIVSCRLERGQNFLDEEKDRSNICVQIGMPCLQSICLPLESSEKYQNPFAKFEAFD